MKRENPEFMPKGLRITDEQFQHLHVQLAATRSTNKTVKLDKEGVQNLLADYSLLIGHVEEIERNLRHPDAARLDAPKGADLI